VSGGSPEPPLVDVGIPTRGAPRYLAEAIESVLAQTFAGWRLTISENGAGGAVEHIVRQYLADPRVEYSSSKSEVTAAENYTRLIRIGHGEFVAVLHDDDRWGPTFLERRVEFLARHRECGFVFSPVKIIDGHGRLLGSNAVPIAPGVHRSSEILPPLFRRNFIGVPSVLVRRAAYEAVGGYSNGVSFVDYEMWLRLAARFPVGLIPWSDAEYRVHPAQASSRDRVGLGAKRLEVLESLPELPISRKVRRRALADGCVRCSLDSVECGERRAAVSWLRRAVATDPTTLVRPLALSRLSVAVLGLATGGTGRRMIAELRSRRFRLGAPAFDE
jgi:glycosyltransferase involved in cell wall biosynthesis